MTRLDNVTFDSDAVTFAIGNVVLNSDDVTFDRDADVDAFDHVVAIAVIAVDAVVGGGHVAVKIVAFLF